MNKYYQEIKIPNEKGRLPVFPKKCTVCDAEIQKENKSSNYWECNIEYRCKGSYQHISQIQNHSNIWRGSCENLSKPLTEVYASY